MILVKIIKRECISYRGKQYTDASSPFAVDDNTAAVLEASGLARVIGSRLQNADASANDKRVYALSDLSSVTSALARVLTAAGITDPAAVLNASDSQLCALRGIGKATAARLRSEAATLLQGE